MSAGSVVMSPVSFLIIGNLCSLLLLVLPRSLSASLTFFTDFFSLFSFIDFCLLFTSASFVLISLFF